jgi:hypothetical protein
VLKTEFPRSLLGKGVKAYRYFVQSDFHEDGHPDCGVSGSAVVVCRDRAPDSGSIRHEL